MYMYMCIYIYIYIHIISYYIISYHIIFEAPKHPDLAPRGGSSYSSNAQMLLHTNSAPYYISTYLSAHIKRTRMICQLHGISVCHTQ